MTDIEQHQVRKISLKTMVSGVAVLFLVGMLSLTVFAYIAPYNSVAERVRTFIPFPAVVVADGMQAISFREVSINIASIRHFYENQTEGFSQAGFRIDFSTPEGKQRLLLKEKEMLNTLVEDRAIQALAHQKNIELDAETAQKAVNEKMRVYGNEKTAVEDRLQSLYRWNIDDFETKVVLPALYREALRKVYADGIDISSRAKQVMREAKEKLDAGSSFEDVAREYSEGDTAKDGGGLGWVPMTNLTPEIAQAVGRQSIGQRSGIIESSLGFHIIVVEDRSQENGQDTVKLKHIFTRKLSFEDWLGEEMKKMHIFVLYKGYHWNRDTARIDFSQSEMREFERETLQKADGDASLIF